MEEEHIYIAIDLKSFYASVECVARGLDPLTTNLVVADESRTEKTICLAVSPSLKSYGISGRARLFEVVSKVREVNAERRRKLPDRKFHGSSDQVEQLQQHADWEVSYLVAPPRMAHYIEVSTRILQIYLKYVSQEDMHVYSIDEVFMDVTHYLRTYEMTAGQLAEKMVRDVLETTGITATAGIGTNMYLCKIAMDVLAKHTLPDEHGVRIASLDEQSYRKLLWNHTPITDFWRVGAGYARRLAAEGMYTMGDVARCSLGSDKEYYNAELLYKMFGVNAELLINHAWGIEPCTIADVKAYKPESNSLGSGQVLQCPYDFENARLVVKEMTDLLVLELVDKKLVTDQMVLTIGYDIDNLANGKKYRGTTTTDRYGRKIPKHAHGTVNLPKQTSSTKQIIQAVMELYDRIVDPKLLIRRINIVANKVQDESTVQEEQSYEQLSLFDDPEQQQERQEVEQKEQKKERGMQEAMLQIKKKYGKNAIVKGMNLQEGATAMSRNRQIGGHRA